MTFRILRVFASPLLLLALPAGLIAASPSVESVVPSAGQRGTEFSLTFGGSRLTDPQEVLLYSAGIECLKVTAKSETEVVASFKTEKDCKLGRHAFRLRTKDGASEVRTFHITAMPVVPEKDDHRTVATAQSVRLNTTIAAVISSGEVDHYAVELKKGQRLSAEVEGVRLAVELTDTVLVILGPDGKQLAFADDTPLFRQDPFASIVAPVDGRYIVQVREANYGGSENAHYLLHIGTFPRPSAIYPAGGQIGIDNDIQLIGDPLGERSVSVRPLPGRIPFEFYASDAGGTAPTANPFRASPFPNHNEVEPNDDPKLVKSAGTWPVAFNGIIEKAGDVDHFRFQARQGDVIDVQAFAYRIGSPVDTVVAVLHANGELLGANDDDETHDSRLEVTIPADGEYLIRVADKRKQGGKNFVYRIELASPTQGLATFLAESVRKSQDRQVIVVPRGNRVTAFLAVRRDNVTGAIALTTGDLPSGVKATLGTIAADEYLLPVTFEASADAPLGGRLVEIVGRQVDAKNPVVGGFAQEVTLVRGPGDSALASVTLDKLAIVVTEESPLTVSLNPPTAPLAADGTLDVLVKITRAKDFTEAVEVFFPCLPPGVEVPTSVVIPADKSEVVVTLVASQDAEIGPWPLIAEATIARPGRGGRDPLMVGNNGLGTPVPAAGGGGRRPRKKLLEGLTPVASEARTVQIEAAIIRGDFAPTTAEPGKPVKVTCSFDSKTPLPGAFTAKLDGLPPRAVVPTIALKSDAKTVTFDLTVDAATPPGDFQTLVCELTGSLNGQRVVYRVGRGGVLKIVAPGSVVTDSQGKTLTPLEVLRLNEKKQSEKK